jgi:predicted lipid carrier protein YhbT
LQRIDGDELLLPEANLKHDMMTQYFREMLNNFNPEKANNLNAVIEYNIDGKNGGSWYFSVKDGGCVLNRGMSQKVPNVSFNMDLDTAYETLVSKTRDRTDAFFAGDVKIKGDTNLPFKIHEIFHAKAV